MSDWVGLLLAAGRSRRFGAPKLLQPLPDGTPITLASARALTAVVPKALAVVNGDEPELDQLLRGAGLELVTVRTRPEGLGASLAAGVAATQDAAGWILALADMPFIRPETIARVLTALRSGAFLAAPYYHGRRGHPVGFARCWGPELLALSGDAGARDLLQRQGTELVRLDCADEGVVRDVDCMEDLNGVNPHFSPAAYCGHR